MEDLMFDATDTQMLDHIVDVVGDRMRSNDGYTEQGEATLSKLERLRDDTKTKNLLVVTLVIVPVSELADDGTTRDGERHPDHDCGERECRRCGGELVDDSTECRNAEGGPYPEHDYGENECRRCGAEPDSV